MPEKSPESPQPLKDPTGESLPVHERPEVKPLIEKAGAEKSQHLPQGTMKTGADVVGGGGTKPLEDDAGKKNGD